MNQRSWMGGCATRAPGPCPRGRPSPFLSPVPARPVDRYHLWFDLRPGTKQADFVAAVDAFVARMREAGTVEGHLLELRKLGFGPDGLGEWHLAITVRDLAQLQAAFDEVAPRDGRTEKLHAAVWSKVTNLRFGLMRELSQS